jgi:hypothetical protein
MGVALSLDGSFGFALQSVKGTYVTPTTWLPLVSLGSGRGESIEQKKNYVLLDMADGKSYQTSYYSAGEWAEGQVKVPVVPGSVSALFSWMQDRDGDNQGKWGSVLVDCINHVKKLTDVKVRKAALDFEKGQPVTCLLDVYGLKMEAGIAATPTMPVAAPYIFREATVQLVKGGGSIAEDVNCEAVHVVMDNVVEDAAEGLRLQESGEPLQLYNLAGVRCYGALSRDFVDHALFQDFMAGREASLLLTLERGSAVATVTLPRIIYSDSDMGLPGSHSERIVEKVGFIALGSADGLTPPVVLA